MAKWTITPKTVNNSMTSQLHYDKGEELTWRVYQDERPYLEQAKQDREAPKKRDLGYKKFATIPDIVAFEISQKHGIDIHEPTFMHDQDKRAKFMTIIKNDYPHLLSY